MKEDLIFPLLSEFAPKYQEELLVKNLQNALKAFTTNNLKDLRQCIQKEPLRFLGFVLGVGFARAGAERAGYGEIAYKVLEKITGNFSLSIKLEPEEVWQEFKNHCIREEKGVNEKLNRGVVEGLIRLNNDVGNIYQWIKETVESAGDIDELFIRLCGIKGVGPKISALILRDLVWLGDLEDKIQAHHFYLQPIDVWIRRIAVYHWDELSEVQDFVIAVRISEACQKLKLSGVRFNQGSWYFATQTKGPYDKDLQGLKDFLKMGKTPPK